MIKFKRCLIQNEKSVCVTFHAILTAIISIVILFSAKTCKAEIVGPETLDAGQMGIYRLTNEAVINVFPVEYQAGLYPDSSGKAFAFASPNPGLVTVVCSSVSDGKAVVEYIIVRNGLDDSLDDDTFPPKDETDTTLVGVVKSEMAKINSENKAREISSLSASFNAVVKAIDTGAITTPVQARESFRITWRQQAISISANTEKVFTGAITALSERINNESIKTIRDDYAAIVSAMEGLK